MGDWKTTDLVEHYLKSDFDQTTKYACPSSRVKDL